MTGYEPLNTPKPVARDIWVIDGQMPRDMRATFAGNRARLRAAVEQMITWGPERIILAHGRWYETDCVAELRRAFRFAL